MYSVHLCIFFMIPCTQYIEIPLLIMILPVSHMKAIKNNLFFFSQDNKILSQFHQISYKFYNVDISCYKSEDIEQWIVENNSAEESVVKSAAASHSDLLPAVYEGMINMLM